MKHTDPRIDTYIEHAADFARPILEHIRALVHKACPEVTETIKWGFPHFEYNGSILCSMASFKRHCAFGFWLGPLMKDPAGILSAKTGKDGMGHLGKIESMSDLPADKLLLQYIQEAATLIEQGAKLSKPKKTQLPEEPALPEAFSQALAGHKKAKEHFEAFSPSHRKEYISWIAEAKTEATRQKRIQTAIEWLTEGKPRNWKYER